ncbi:hypothetical protein [Legionella maceachernii]|uniref:hypothetical protein n=1 Tax=Legionella maceachernii TaxID=466 RepID=UPI001BDFB4E5|nr:hypothetical protein [Legionella maceachernii]
MPQEILRFAQDDNQHVILSKSEGPPDSWQWLTPGDPSLRSGRQYHFGRTINAQDDNQHVILSKSEGPPDS